jgi:hypothetical protein
MTTRYRCQNETCSETFYFPAKEKTTLINLSDQKETIELTVCPHCKQTNFTQEEAPQITSIIKCAPQEADNHIKQGYHVLPEKIFENTVVLVKYAAAPEPENQKRAECSKGSNNNHNKGTDKNKPQPKRPSTSGHTPQIKALEVET